MPSKDSTKAGSPPKARRKRRTSEEIVGRILEAAAEEFERLGYAGATTASIAKRANVAEALIFSNFGSKARLFQDSVFKPLNQHLLEFCRDHLADADLSEQSQESLRVRYISELEQFIERHSRKFLSLFYAHLYGDGEQGLNAVEGMQEYFNAAIEIQSARKGTTRRLDPAIMGRLCFAAIFSSIVLRDWLFPDGSHGKAEIDAATVAFAIGGLNAGLDHKGAGGG